MKPITYKAYGSIPHITGYNSKFSKGDKGLNPGQTKILFKQHSRKNDRIITQIKLDGSCCAVRKHNGYLTPLTRVGRIANTSSFTQHHKFAKFVALHYDAFNMLLNDGERVVGEWLYQVHGTRYALIDEPMIKLFPLFDIFTKDNKRIPFDSFKHRVSLTGFLTVPEITKEYSKLDEILPELETNYGFNVVGKHEGFIFRCEHEGKFDFLGKYVRPDFIPGKYLNKDIEYYNTDNF